MPPVLAQVLPGLYIGNLATVRDPASMRLIDSVVSALKPGTLKQAPWAGQKDWLYVRVADAPSADIASYFYTVFKFIEKQRRAGHSVLVHCAAGVSRSVTLVISYLLLKGVERSVEGALSRIRKVRPNARPNPGFILQLEESLWV